jgi:hypothetical protein
VNVPGARFLVVVAVIGFVGGLSVCGCTSPQQAAIDDAYHRGRISSEERDRRLRELDQQRMAEHMESVRISQQQPEGKRGEKLVYPQREDE